MKKALVLFVTAAMVCFMATAAMAGNNTTRDAEMTANSPCDQAGSVQYELTEDDWDAIANFLYVENHDYVEIRVTLTGTDVDSGDASPELCKDIQGSSYADGVPHSGDLVALDTLDFEISDVALGGNGEADFEAYVYGDEGDTRFFIYITDLGDDEPIWGNVEEWPWMKVGLYEEVIDTDQPGDDEYSTAICADVTDYEGVNKLIIANDVTPQNITFTGDVYIGHFQPQDFTVEDCDKDQDDNCNTSDEYIELCDEEDPGLNQIATCPIYDKCIAVEGDFPADGDFELQVKSLTPGVYLYDVSVYSDGSYISGNFDLFFADCETDEDLDTDCDDYEAKCARSGILDMEDVNGEEIVFCVRYTVNVDEAVAGDVVEFEVSGNTLPCGALFSDTIEAATLVNCSGMEDLMYFPYVLTGSQPWSTGVVVTNMAPADITAEDMEVTFILTDSNGDTYTETVDDFTTVVWSGNLDNAAADWGWAPAAGNAWLKVIANFPVDGYCYLTNGQFGAGTLPRLYGCKKDQFGIDGK